MKLEKYAALITDIAYHGFLSVCDRLQKNIASNENSYDRKWAEILIASFFALIGPQYQLQVVNKYKNCFCQSLEMTIRISGALILSNQLVPAIALLDQALFNTLRPHQPIKCAPAELTYCNLGVALSKPGKWPAARKHYQYAVAQLPENYDILSSLVVSVLRRGQSGSSVTKIFENLPNPSAKIALMLNVQLPFTEDALKILQQYSTADFTIALNLKTFPGEQDYLIKKILV